MHEQLIETKIPIFKGKGAKNNKIVIKALALYGPLIKYDIFKVAQRIGSKKRVYYETLSRRVDDLKNKDYIKQAGTRTITVGKRKDKSPTYGLTWRGLIASLVFEDVRSNTLSTIKKNLHSALPRKISLGNLELEAGETYPLILEFMAKAYPPEVLEAWITAGLLSFLRQTPSIERIEQEDLWGYALPTVREAASEVNRSYPQEAKARIGALAELLDNPKTLELAKKGIPAIANYYSQQLEALQSIVMILNAVRQVILDLKPEDKASEKVMQELPKLLLKDSSIKGENSP